MGDDVPSNEVRSAWPHVICFSDNDRNRIAASKRAAVLFDRDPVEDPILHYAPAKYHKTGGILVSFGNRIERLTPKPFKLVPSQFLERARALAPIDPQPSASAFSQWVYSIYGKHMGDEDDLRAGTEAESEIFKKRKASAAGCLDQKFLRESNSDWELIHNGMRINEADLGYFSIPQLEVNGNALRASPDLIYQNRRNSEIVIVEIKFSRLPLTTNLWPNVWAQLWCYSHSPVVISAPAVRVVGEIWGTRWIKKEHVSRINNRISRRGYKENELVLRSSVQRNPRERQFDRFFRELFNIYRRSDAIS